VLYNETNQPENLEVKPKKEVDTDHKGTERWKKLSRRRGIRRLQFMMMYV
jgi:hypothetical protein